MKLKAKSKEVLQKRPAGFTLLEVVIAMAIMLVTFTSILAVEGDSIRASDKAKQMNIVSMLAKNQMVETEFKIRKKPFEEVKKEESGTFKSPYEDYKWKTEIKETKLFSDIGKLIAGNKEGAVDANLSMVTQLLTNYLSKAIREVTVTVSWQRGSKEQSYSLTTLWVDLNHEFSLSQ
jgi:type II secretion system protein I